MRKTVSKPAKKKAATKTRVKAKRLSTRKNATLKAAKKDAKLARKASVPAFPRTVIPNESGDPAHAAGHRHLHLEFAKVPNKSRGI